GFLKDRSTDAVVTHETARAAMKVGILNQQLKRMDQAENALRQAIALLEKLTEKFPAVPEIRLDLAHCYGELAALHLWSHQPQEEFHERRKAVTLLEKLVTDFPTVPAHARELAMAHSALADDLAGG